MSKINSPKSAKELPQAVVTQMLALATSGFGLVAALAWNEVVKETVNAYIRPWLPDGAGLISLLLYAVLVTVLAVMVTLQLTKLQEIFKREERTAKKKAAKK